MEAVLRRADRILDYLRSQLGSGRYTVPLITIGVIFALTALRGLADDFAIAIGHPKAGMFMYADDRFADFFKAALSFKRITGVLITSRAFMTWPQTYQGYLLDKFVTGSLELNSFHVPPVSGLMFLLAAKLFVLIGLWKTYILFIAVYIALAFGLLHLFCKAARLDHSDFVAGLYPFFLSFPALWMFQRGNFNSGYTSVLVAAYVVSAVSRRYRWLGWLCLAVAVNIRPNVAIMATLEFSESATFWSGAGAVAIPASMSIALMLSSYFAMNYFYPDYTIAAFMKAQAVYNELYVKWGGGDLWNTSLYQSAKLIRHALGYPMPWFSDLVYDCITAAAAISYLAILFMAARKALGAVELAFLLCVFTTFFTPVFAVYHNLEFAAPLLVIIADSRPLLGVRRDYWIIFAGCLLMLVPLAGRQSNGVFEDILLLCVAAITLMHGWRRLWLSPAVASTARA